MCEEKYVPNFVLMEKKETRLVFVDDPKQRKQEVLGEIFRISKWDENNTVAILNEMKNLEFVSGKGSAGSDVFFKLLYMMIKKDGGKSTESEYRLRTLIEQYIEKEVMDSYGMYIPTFVNELKKMGNKDTNHKALLIGVMSAQSHQEFSACVAKVFPNNMANSIDIDPNDELKKCSNFCEMDVFNMTGIENNSIDSIHMHIFLSDFVNGDEETLWKIVYEKLKTGGKIMAVEYRKRGSFSLIQKAGFRNITINHNIYGFKNRGCLDHFMRSGEDYQIEQKPLYKLITAVK